MIIIHATKKLLAKLPVAEEKPKAVSGIS